MALILVKTKEDFDEAVRQGRTKGHTHIKLMREGYCDRTVSMDSVAFKNISSNPIGHSVYAVRTGFPVYANYNRFRYSPEVVGVSKKPNEFFGNGLMNFMMN